MNNQDFDDDGLEIDHQSLERVRRAVDTAIHLTDPGIYIDERQLSSDLDATLKLYHNDVTAVQPKSETRDSCMYAGQDNAASASSGGAFMPQQPVHGEMHAGYIRQPTFNPWSQSPSMSDIEMDNAPSLMSVPQPPPQYPYKPKQPDILTLEGSRPFGSYGNAAWDGKQQLGQGYSECRGETAEVDVAMETDVKFDGLTYQLDEIGENALHTLSLVTDKTVMAKVLEAIQTSSNFNEMLNMQNKLKQTPLFLAVQAFNIPLIGWLLQQGADPNVQGTLNTGRHDYVWRAPIHLVAMMGDKAISVLQLMLSKYPHLNLNLLSIGDKLTPLHIALKTHSLPDNSCKHLILELIKRGADVGIREQSSSKTPLILAIETRDLDLIREYLEMFTADRRRALLQDKTRSGDTCLHIAAGMSRFPSHLKEVLLRMLVMNGANGNTANNAKELPRDFARTEWDRIRS